VTDYWLLGKLPAIYEPVEPAAAELDADDAETESAPGETTPSGNPGPATTPLQEREQ